MPHCLIPARSRICDTVAASICVYFTARIADALLLKALVLIAIGLFIGAFCALAATNALAKRNAHGRAVMVVLAKHMDELRHMDATVDCDAVIRPHVEQIAFAARDIGFAFPRLAGDALFERRNTHFRELAAAATTASCDELPGRVARLSDDCTACHRQFR